MSIYGSASWPVQLGWAGWAARDAMQKAWASSGPGGNWLLPVCAVCSPTDNRVRLYAFVTYEDRAAAASAKKILSGKKIPHITGEMSVICHRPASGLC